jgi:hypothetical protein
LVYHSLEIEWAALHSLPFLQELLPGDSESPLNSLHQNYNQKSRLRTQKQNVK